MHPLTKPASGPTNSSSALTNLERALLRLLVIGYTLEEAARSVGLSPHEADEALQSLQGRVGVSCTSRLLAIAILRSWV